jgi:hypothetical protein
VSERTFTAATEELLIELIGKARRRIVFIAPGVTEKVANALGDCFAQEDKLSIEVILDADPEVYRLGFGTVEGITKLKSHADANHLPLRHQAGIRLGILISDDKTLIYAPTPQLIEAGSTSAEKPNAVLLDGQEASSIVKAAGAGPDALPMSGEIGKGSLTPQQLQAVTDDLKRNPPKPFDLARQANVFSSQLQYVEFHVDNYKLTNMLAPIPTDLLGVAGDEDLERRWKSRFRLFDAESASVTLTRPGPNGPEQIRVNQKYLDDQKKRLERDFLFSISGYGNVLFKEKQTEFEQAVESLRVVLGEYYTAIKANLSERVSKTVDEITESLVDRVTANPPKRFAKHSASPSKPEIRERLKVELSEALSPDKALQPPAVRYVFKDISYQSFQTTDFMTKLHTVLQRGGVPASRLKGIFKESLAILESEGKLV